MECTGLEESWRSRESCKKRVVYKIGGLDRKRRQFEVTWSVEILRYTTSMHVRGINTAYPYISNPNKSTN